MRPLVVCSVGTDHHVFDRLVGWLDQWAKMHPDHEVVIQYGSATPPSTAEGHELIPHATLKGLFARASVVISHGGPSTIMDIRRAGHLPIVVARNPELDEHVDGHQMRFAEHLARHHMAAVADSEPELLALIDKALADPCDFMVEKQADGVPEGMVALASHLDDLLGVSTPLDLPSGDTSA